jgi:cysteine desulfurase/selenocysteine lyase
MNAGASIGLADFSARVRADFPFLQRKIHGKGNIYLDNAATTQKPAMVIESVVDFYTHHCANVHRGIHTLSQEATSLLEAARQRTADFIHAQPNEIIFTAGTTAAINMVAHAFNQKHLDGQAIIVSVMEHHSNLLPWMDLCKRKNMRLLVAEVNEAGELSLDQIEEFLKNNQVALVCISHVSNTLGTVNPVKELVHLAHRYGSEILIDGAQAVMHQSPDMKDLKADYYCFSGHKMFGPSGIGVLYVNAALADHFPVYQHGGGTIKEVSLDAVTYAEGPARLEAGTPNIEGIIGLGAAISYIEKTGKENIQRRENELLLYCLEIIRSFPELKILGSPSHRSGLISVYSDRFHPSDLGTLLDQQGIAIRTGHHCTQPLMKRFGIAGTARFSFAAYNTEEELDVLNKALHKALSMLL